MCCRPFSLYNTYDIYLFIYIPREKTILYGARSATQLAKSTLSQESQQRVVSLLLFFLISKIDYYKQTGQSILQNKINYIKLEALIEPPSHTSSIVAEA